MSRFDDDSEFSPPDTNRPPRRHNAAPSIASFTVDGGRYAGRVASDTMDEATATEADGLGQPATVPLPKRAERA